MTFENVRSEFGNRGVGEARKLIRETLEQYLHRRIFAGAVGSTVQPDARDSRGFAAFMKQYIRCLAVERAAIDALP